MRPIDFEVKRSKIKVMAHGYLKNGFRTITDSVINQWSWNFIHLLAMSQGCALLILRSKGQKVKGQGHGAWLFENGFRTITDSVINQWSWNFIHLLTMSQGCALLILRSKGQRSRSWRMVIWKWFPDDNWLCNQPMIMKLHTLTHHESRMRPIDFEVQRSRSWCMVIWKWFPDDNWLCNQPMIMKLHTLTPHEFVGVGGGPVLLQQYFQYAFIITEIANYKDSAFYYFVIKKRPVRIPLYGVCLVVTCFDSHNKLHFIIKATTGYLCSGNTNLYFRIYWWRTVNMVKSLYYSWAFYFRDICQDISYFANMKCCKYVCYMQCKIRCLTGLPWI